MFSLDISLVYQTSINWLYHQIRIYRYLRIIFYYIKLRYLEVNWSIVDERISIRAIKGANECQRKCELCIKRDIYHTFEDIKIKQISHHTGNIGKHKLCIELKKDSVGMV